MERSQQARRACRSARRPRRRCACLPPRVRASCHHCCVAQPMSPVHLLHVVERLSLSRLTCLFMSNSAPPSFPSPPQRPSADFFSSSTIGAASAFSMARGKGKKNQSNRLIHSPTFACATCCTSPENLGSTQPANMGSTLASRSGSAPRERVATRPKYAAVHHRPIPPGSRQRASTRHSAAPHAQPKLNTALPQPTASP